MKKELKYVRVAALIFVFNAVSNVLTAQTMRAPAILWAKTYGGSYLDVSTSLTTTANDGIMICGSTGSTDGDVTDNHSTAGDAWLVQTDNSGTITSKKCYGGTAGDGASYIEQTKDGGYIMTGGTNSTDGDIHGFHGGVGSDIWVVKLSVSGSIMWQKCLGGTNIDIPSNVLSTMDGGYIVSGYTYSSDGDVSGFHTGSGPDGWLIKLDDTGKIEWQRPLGGTGVDYINFVIQTADSGYAAVGYTSSIDGDVSGDHSGSMGVPTEDVWVVKLSGNGTLQWQKCFGGSQQDEGNKIKMTNDGNYIIAGWSNSSDGDVSGSHTSISAFGDEWILKISSTGSIMWQKCYGGNNADQATDIVPTYDGGYIVAGSTESNDGDVSGFRGLDDFWVTKIDANGKLAWEKTMGGTNLDLALAVMQVADSGYVVSGWTKSSNYDVSGYHDKDSGTSNGDYWVVKLGKDPLGVATISVANNIAVYPNPSSGVFLVDTDVPKGCSAAVYNMMGSCVYNGVLQAGQNKINLSNEPAGIYFIQLRGSDGSVRTERLVIER